MSTETNTATRFEAITFEDVQSVESWIIPPKSQDHNVERAYAMGAANANGTPIYRRTTYQSDGTVRYERRLLGDDETFEPSDYEPGATERYLRDR